MTYGIIGTGTIAASVVAGLCGHGDTAPTILLSPRNARVAAGLAARFPSARVATDNQAVIDGASVLLLCVRPQDAESALTGLRFREDLAVVSVMAGVSLATLRRLVAPARDIARSIPLPSVARREGLTAIHPGTAAARALFDPLGGTLPLPDEAAFEAVSATTATIAAHFAGLEAIAGWLTAHSIPEASARQFVASMFAGLGATLRGGEPNFHDLAREYATPGGINEQFVGVLKAAGVYATMRDGLDGVLARLARGAGVNPT